MFYMNFIQKFGYIIFITLVLSPSSYAIVICTAANSAYFPHVISLIGSIHKINFNELQEIMVFDLGLQKSEIKRLNSIKKVHVYSVQKTHPAILDFAQAPQGYRSLGWFAWKPVVIKQTLDKYEHALWLDAGSTVLKSLTPIFDHLKKEGSFICIIGDEKIGNKWKHPVSWGTTKFIRDKYKLDTPENCWILDQEFIAGGIIGASRDHETYDNFFLPLYESTFDIRNFEDDGSPSGLGRHDQTVMSFLVYQQNLKFFQQDYTQQKPMVVAGHEINATWNAQYINENTTIYSSRNNLFALDNFEKYLQYRQ